MSTSKRIAAANSLLSARRAAMRPSERRIKAGHYAISWKGVEFELIQSRLRGWKNPGYWVLRPVISYQNLGPVVCGNTTKTAVLEMLRIEGEYPWGKNTPLAALFLPIVPGAQFQDAQPMEVVRQHETLPRNWWSKGLTDEVGLFAYHENFILAHRLP